MPDDTFEEDGNCVDCEAIVLVYGPEEVLSGVLIGEEDSNVAETLEHRALVLQQAVSV